MNRHFINIKVDREERPDLDEIYQKSAQVFTGRGGGWPLTMFLTPDQEPFYGGTYFPPVSRHSLPGFPDVLLGVVEAYQASSRRCPKEHRTGEDRITANQHAENCRRNPLTDRLCSMMRAMSLGQFFDPRPWRIRRGTEISDRSTTESVVASNGSGKTMSCIRSKVLLQLRTMAAGGIYDHLGGGFHRYSVDGQWMIPHFEKMLYDNAQLVRIYLDGWRLTKENRFREVVEETLDYVRRELTHPDGAFFAAQDADSEGHEGAYFVWEPGGDCRGAGSRTG